MAARLLTMLQQLALLPLDAAPEVVAHDARRSELFAYFCEEALAWHDHGVVLEPEARAAVVAAWRTGRHRAFLNGLIGSYPCPEFLPIWDKDRLWRGAGLRAWLRAFPELGDVVRPKLLSQGRRFTQLQLALDAGLHLARSFPDEATVEEGYRLVALALNYAERRRRRRDADAATRALIEGDVSRQEALRINAHLLELGASPLNDPATGFAVVALPDVPSSPR
jgi:hypothetical protein